MRVTCIALAAVALALAKKPQQAPERVSRNTYNTYALSAETRTPATSDRVVAAPAAATAASVIDFTPLPSGRASAEPPADRPVLVASNDTTRCVTVKEGDRQASVVVAGCAPSAAQSFIVVGGEIRTPGEMCITAPDTRDNAVRPVSLEPCNGSVSQQWESTSTGELRGYRGKCLTAASGLQRRQGTPLAVRGCMGRADQRWSQRAATTGPARVDSIRVNAVALSLAPGRSSKVNAFAIDAQGRELGGEAVTWASADPTVAVVSSTGVVTGIGGGSTTVVAMAQGRVKSVTVEVRGAQYAGVESGTSTYGADRP